jgi:hypothetical protein
MSAKLDRIQDAVSQSLTDAQGDLRRHTPPWSIAPLTLC